jgi:hypothetical protein
MTEGKQIIMSFSQNNMAIKSLLHVIYIYSLTNSFHINVNYDNRRAETAVITYNSRLIITTFLPSGGNKSNNNTHIFLKVGKLRK